MLHQITCCFLDGQCPLTVLETRTPQCLTGWLSVLVRCSSIEFKCRILSYHRSGHRKSRSDPALGSRTETSGCSTVVLLLNSSKLHLCCRPITENPTHVQLISWCDLVQQIQPSPSQAANPTPKTSSLTCQSHTDWTRADVHGLECPDEWAYGNDSLQQMLLKK